MYGFFSIHACTVYLIYMCEPGHNSLWTYTIILLYILWTALFGFGGWGGVMTGLPLP